MKTKQKQLIEENINLIENNDWEQLTAAVGPNGFANILPILVEASIIPFSVINKFIPEELLDVCDYLADISGKTRYELDMPGEYAERILNEINTDNYIDTKLVVELSQKLGFVVYETTKHGEGSIGAPDYLILHPSCSLKRYVAFEIKNADEQDDAWSIEDFREIS